MSIRWIDELVQKFKNMLRELIGEATNQDKFKEYDGQFCRVFTANSTCLTGYVTIKNGCALIKHPNGQQCVVSLNYVISMSDYQPKHCYY